MGMKKSETENQLLILDKSNIYRNINDIYQKNLNNFANIENKNFDIFDFEKKVGKENTLVLISRYIFNYFQLFQFQ